MFAGDQNDEEDASFECCIITQFIFAYLTVN